MRSFLLVLLLVSCCSSVRSELFTGSTSSGSESSFLFLSKFVYDYSPDDGKTSGKFYMEIDIPDQYQQDDIVLGVYDDQDESWPIVYNTDLPCQQKLIDQYHNRTDGSEIRGPARRSYNITKDREGVVQRVSNTTYVITQEVSQHVRPRYWFFAIGSCKPLSVTYKIHLTNFLRDAWNIEFGTNIMGLNTLYLIYFIVYVIFLTLHLFGVRTLAQKQKYVHPLVKLFLGILFIQFAAIMCYLVHYANFASTGVGYVFLSRIAEVIDIFARLAFIFLLILLAKGWTISGDELTNKFAILFFVIGFAIIEVGTIVWKYAVDDPARTSVSGGVLVFNNALIAGWFIFAIFFLYTIFRSFRREENPHKKSLYFKLAVVYGIWFLAPPTVAVLSNALDDWMRDKVIQSLTLTFTTLAYFFLAFLTWPSRAEEYFAISTPDVMLGINSNDNYNQL